MHAQYVTAGGLEFISGGAESINIRLITDILAISSTNVQLSNLYPLSVWSVTPNTSGDQSCRYIYCLPSATIPRPPEIREPTSTMYVHDREGSVGTPTSLGTCIHNLLSHYNIDSIFSRLDRDYWRPEMLFIRPSTMESEAQLWLLVMSIIKSLYLVRKFKFGNEFGQVPGFGRAEAHKLVLHYSMDHIIDDLIQSLVGIFATFGVAKGDGDFRKSGPAAEQSVRATTTALVYLYEFLAMTGPEKPWRLPPQITNSFESVEVQKYRNMYWKVGELGPDTSLLRTHGRQSVRIEYLEATKFMSSGFPITESRLSRSDRLYTYIPENIRQRLFEEWGKFRVNFELLETFNVFVAETGYIRLATLLLEEHSRR